MDSKKLSIDYAGKELSIETGKLAQLASGSMTVRYGDTVILVTAVVGKEPRDIDYLPLSVEYEERLYAAGKISGSRFIKREGRPTEAAILTARLVDRSIRPLCDKTFRNDIQVIITVLSYDLQNNPDMIAVMGASAALIQAGAPFRGPVGAAKVACIDGKFILNPTTEEIEKSELNLFVSGTSEKVLMIEADAKEASEELVEKGIEFAHKSYQEIIKFQDKMEVKKLEIVKGEDKAAPIREEIKTKIGSKLKDAITTTEKGEREESLDLLKAEVVEALKEQFEEVDIKKAFGEVMEKEVRRLAIEENMRPDGRKFDELRKITAEVGLIPRVHGTGLFTRGQTQALTIATLGAPGDEQMIDTMEEEGTKSYMHHYNFPPFSTGEARPMRGTSRREIGHGALAEKALIPVLPSSEDFPYTIRLVSEILASNGSSSMAATCGSTLALMDAGVPIKAPVAGIAIGLMTGKVKDKDVYKILTDIQGVEDFAGDMDFKIAGTRDGITAIQLDVKLDGLMPEMVHDALVAGKAARSQVLDIMKEAIPAPRPEISPYAPRIYTIMINPDRIGELIGPAGKNINGIITEAGGKDLVNIDIEDDGTVHISSIDKEAAEKAMLLVEGMMREVKVGEIFSGPVIQIIKDRMTGKEIGAVVKILPNQEGMVHISQLADQHVAKINDVVNIGDIIPVKVMEIDRERGRISLSLKAARANEKAKETTE